MSLCLLPAARCSAGSGACRAKHLNQTSEHNHGKEEEHDADEYDVDGGGHDGGRAD